MKGATCQDDAKGCSGGNLRRAITAPRGRVKTVLKVCKERDRPDRLIAGALDNAKGCKARDRPAS